MVPEFVTIGVYGYSENQFFQTLVNAGVDTFCDIRARRGVRGSQYAFANSKRLQARLAELDIRYLHFPTLAPGRELRQLQADADRTSRKAKRQRQHLSPDFVAAYEAEVLAGFESARFLAELPEDARTVSLFCVEGTPAACHRSLLAARLAADLAAPIRHLIPDE